MDDSTLPSIVLVVLLCLCFGYAIHQVQVDINTGQTKLIMADITDKKHVHNSCLQPIFNDEFEITGFKTIEEDHYFVYYKRTDGIFSHITCSSKEEMDKYKIGQRFIVKVVIGGQSKREYFLSISEFLGAEAQK